MRATDKRDPTAIAILPQQPDAMRRTTAHNDAHPIAIVTDVARNTRVASPGLWYFLGIDVCPLCGLQHMHGERRDLSAQVQVSHRNSHCRANTGSYLLVINWSTVRVAPPVGRLFTRDRRRPPKGWTPGVRAEVLQ